jgi:hypothetical protein
MPSKPDEIQKAIPWAASLVAVTAAIAVGCSPAEPANGTLRCAATSPACPSGFYCSLPSRTCWRDGIDAAATGDATVSTLADTSPTDGATDLPGGREVARLDLGGIGDGLTTAEEVQVHVDLPAAAPDLPIEQSYEDGRPDVPLTSTDLAIDLSVDQTGEAALAFDLGAEHGLEITPDVAADLAPDLPPDAPPDAPPDTAPDAPPDTAPDAPPDVPPDTAPDAPPDVAPDGPQTTLLPAGGACTGPAQCADRLPCLQGRCGKVSVGNDCHWDSDCSSSSSTVLVGCSTTNPEVAGVCIVRNSNCNPATGLSAPCGSPTDCCTGACFSGYCDFVNCQIPGMACSSAGDCCYDNCAGTCLPACTELGQSCTSNADCCSRSCIGNVCAYVACQASGASCTSSRNCCSGVCKSTLTCL